MPKWSRIQRISSISSCASRVHARRRLVEAEQPCGSRGHGARDLEAPLLAVRQVLRAARRPAPSSLKIFEQLARLVVDALPPRRGERRCAASAAKHARLLLAVEGHLARCRARSGSRRAGCSGTCARCRAALIVVRLQRPRSSLPSRRTSPLGGRVDAGDQVEDRRLARAVGADQPVEVALARGEARPRSRPPRPPKRMVTSCELEQRRHVRLGLRAGLHLVGGLRGRGRNAAKSRCRSRPWGRKIMMTMSSSEKSTMRYCSNGAQHLGQHV